MTESELLARINGKAHANALRSLTGAVSVTVTHETRLADGTLRVDAVATSEPSDEPGSGGNAFAGNPNASAAAVARAEADLAARYAALDEAISKCRGCKAAKTRLARGTNRFPSAAERRGECQNHNDARRTYYATSPLSETYWTS